MRQTVGWIEVPFLTPPPNFLGLGGGWGSPWGGTGVGVTRTSTCIPQNDPSIVLIILNTQLENTPKGPTNCALVGVRDSPPICGSRIPKKQ